MISFSHPIYLLLLFLLPVLIAISRSSLSDMRRGRARFSLGLRCGIFTLLVLALAGLQVSRPSKKLAVLFVLDRSDSIPAEQREAAVQFVNQAAKRMGPNHTAGVLVFGGDAYVEFMPSPKLKLTNIASVISRDYTDLAGALRLALAAFPEDAQKRIVLLSDGNENLGNAVEEANAAASAGVQIDTVPITYEYPREVMLDRLVVPSEAKEGEPFDVEVIASSTYETDGVLRFWQDSSYVGEQKVHLLPGKNRFKIARSLPKPAFYQFEARLELPQGGKAAMSAGTVDTLADNNKAMGFSLVRGKPRVLYVEGDPRDGAYLARALKAERVDVELRSPAEMPRNLAELQNFDSLVLSNVAAWELSPDQMKMIQSNVRDLGGGLVMVGGEHSFGAGAYGGTPIEAALPLDMDVQKKKNMPTGAVAMVMHSCEFPDGNKWAAETAAAVIDVLGAQDKVGMLIYGNTGEQWAFPMQLASNKDRLKQMVYTVAPGDMPTFDPIVRMALDGLKRTEAQVKHVIVLSDGDPSPPAPQVYQALRAAKITISTVAVFPHGNSTATLEEMAKKTGGRFYNVKSANEIPRIFLKEATYALKPAIIEEPFFPKSDPTQPLLKGFSTSSFPPLLGYVAATPKPLVDVAMVSKRDDPVLASWRYGLGKAVAFTSDAKNRWAAQWVDWGGFSKFWAQLVRWTVRSSAKTNFETNVEIVRRQGRVTVDALDRNGAFVNFLEIRGSVSSPTMKSLPLRMEQTAPGRYEGSFDASEVGQYILSLSHKDEKGVLRVHTTGAAVAYSPEYRELRANQPLLTRLSDISGGVVHAPLEGVRRAASGVSKDGQGTATDAHASRLTPDAFFRHGGRTRTAPQELWPLLLLLAALLFPLDVGVRRLMLSPEEVMGYARRGGEWLRARVPSRAAQPEQREQALSRLLAAKERAEEQGAEGGEPGTREAGGTESGERPAEGAASTTAEPLAATSATPPDTKESPEQPAVPRVVWGRRPPGVEPSPPSGSTARPRDAAQPPRPAPEAEPGGSSTSRLLDAKRRARQKPDEE
jgi:uncharacterized membrane protein/Mg-chelatase subunit ChlD